MVNCNYRKKQLKLLTYRIRPQKCSFPTLITFQEDVDTNSLDRQGVGILCNFGHMV